MKATWNRCARNHQQRIEQARETFRRKMEDRAKIINELQQGLEASCSYCGPLISQVLNGFDIQRAVTSCLACLLE
eukprot:4618445-Amphidinium_carterae.1